MKWKKNEIKNAFDIDILYLIGKYPAYTWQDSLNRITPDSVVYFPRIPFRLDRLELEQRFLVNPFFLEQLFSVNNRIALYSYKAFFLDHVNLT